MSPDAPAPRAVHDCEARRCGGCPACCAWCDADEPHLECEPARWREPS